MFSVLSQMGETVWFVSLGGVAKLAVMAMMRVWKYQLKASAISFESSSCWPLHIIYVVVFDSLRGVWDRRSLAGIQLPRSCLILLTKLTLRCKSRSFLNRIIFSNVWKSKVCLWIFCSLGISFSNLKISLIPIGRDWALWTVRYLLIECNFSHNTSEAFWTPDEKITSGQSKLRVAAVGAAYLAKF